jgi:hypothetical protein
MKTLIAALLLAMSGGPASAEPEIGTALQAKVTVKKNCAVKILTYWEKEGDEPWVVTDREVVRRKNRSCGRS